MDEPISLPEPDQEWHARHNHTSRQPLQWRRPLAVIILVLVILFAGIVGGVVGFVAIANTNAVWAREVRKVLHIDNLAELRVPIVQDLKLEESSAVIDAAKKVSPAVVSITANANVVDFFGNTSSQEISGGTGFILTSDGLILTNKHVVSQDANYKVVLSDGRIFDATVKARDTLNDLAVVKIDAKDLPTVELGSSDGLRIGQYVIAVGNALGEFNNSVTLGVVSAKDRSLSGVGQGQGNQSEDLSDLIQTDAAINPGNSGGPLVNLSGQVVGINTAIASTTGGSIGLGFAISIDSVKSVVDSVRLTGEIIRPYLGVRYLPVTKAVQTANNLSVDYGALVRGDAQNLGVLANSPAEKAGIQEGDILLEINGSKIDEKNALTKLLQKYQVGDKITVKLLRKGQEQTVTVTLERLPNS
jgi:serine protease Do